jgi:hypothetical protein
MLLDRRMPPRRARSKAEMGHVILLRHSAAAMKPLIAKLAIGVLVTTSATPALTNRANAEFLENRTLISQSGNTPETLRNVRFSTSKKFIIMPVADKSGNSERQMGDINLQKMLVNEFATEAFNQSIREAGATTISWFKINNSLNELNNQTGANRVDLTNDLFVPELLKVGKSLGAQYIIRASLINSSFSVKQRSSINPFTCALFMGCGKKKTVDKNITASIKLDIISVKEEDIIGTKTFEGSVRTRQQSGGIFGGGNEANETNKEDAETRSAISDAVDKAVDFIVSKVN